MFAGPETNVSNTVSEVEKLLSVTECLMLNWISNGKLNDDDFDSILIAILEVPLINRDFLKVILFLVVRF